MHFDPILIWFLIGLALLLSEFALPGVILVFFGIGAWITSITCWTGLTPGLASQLLTFTISSVVLLVLLRRWFRVKFFGYVEGDQSPEDNIDDLAGNEVVVSDKILPGKTGQVQYKGATWSARCDATLGDSMLAEGTPAVIVRAEGITLVVRPRD